MAKRKNNKPYDILGGSKPRTGKYIGPGEGRPTKKATAKKTTVKHVSQIKAKPKPKPQPRQPGTQPKRGPNLEPGLAAAIRRSQGGPKTPTVKKTVVKKSTARKATVQKSGYDPLAGPKAPAKNGKKTDVAKNGKKTDAQRIKEWETEMRALWKRLYGTKK